MTYHGVCDMNGDLEIRILRRQWLMCVSDNSAGESESLREMLENFLVKATTRCFDTMLRKKREKEQRKIETLYYIQ